MKDFGPLTKSKGCIRDIRFRGVIPRCVPVESVSPVLQAMGYSFERVRDGVSSFEDDQGNTLVLLSTGDVEIRISYAVPYTQRSTFAKGLWKSLGRACRSR